MPQLTGASGSRIEKECRSSNERAVLEFSLSSIRSMLGARFGMAESKDVAKPACAEYWRTAQGREGARKL